MTGVQTCALPIWSRREVERGGTRESRVDSKEKLGEISLAERQIGGRVKSEGN